MKSTRNLAVFAAAGMSIALSGCGGSTGDSGGASSSGGGGGDCSSAETFCIGLVTDAGKVDDKSFNQSAWEGVKAAAKETNAQTKYLQPTSPKDYASSIKQFADAKYDVIVTVGFNIAKDTTTAAKTFPDVKFIGIDQAQTATVANLTGLVFPEDQAGYAAGYLGGLLTKTNKIGQVLGELLEDQRALVDGQPPQALLPHGAGMVHDAAHVQPLGADQSQRLTRGGIGQRVGALRVLRGPPGVPQVAGEDALGGGGGAHG